MMKKIWKRGILVLSLIILNANYIKATENINIVTNSGFELDKKKDGIPDNWVLIIMDKKRCPGIPH